MAKKSHKQSKAERRTAVRKPASRAPLQDLLKNVVAHSGLATIIILIVIYGFGSFIRFEDYPKWRENPDIYFFNGAPLLANIDGFYYLRLARDLSEDRYDAVDSLRSYPDALQRPSPPPLLSVAANLLHKIFRTSLDWIAVLLPVLLAPLLLLPVYGLARAAGGGSIMALTASLMCVVAEIYVGRTRIGWFDTDCLIVTLITTVCYFCWRFACETSMRRYIYWAAAATGYAIFVWWWDSVRDIANAICIAMFAVTLVFYYRPARREGMIFAAVTAGAAVLFLLWCGFDAPLLFIRNLHDKLLFVAGGETGPFPSAVTTVTELQVFGFMQMTKLVSGHAIIFIAAAGGFAWLLVSLKKRVFLLAVLILLALLPYRFGSRFLLFQVPVAALGLGFLAEKLWHLKSKWKFTGAAAVVVALLPPVVCSSYCLPNFYRPLTDKSLRAIQAVIDETAAGAVLWTTWRHGYALQYYARRATITDGGTLQGQRLVFQNMPFACSNPRMAANLMQFWIGRGSAGMDRLYDAMNGDYAAALRLLKFVCASGPDAARTRINEIISTGEIATSAELVTADDWVKFFFPADTPPTYMLLMWDLSWSTDWFRRGSWDPAKRRGEDAFYRHYYGIRLIDGQLRNNRGLFVDIANGTILLSDEAGTKKPYPLAHVVTFTGEKIERTAYDNRGTVFFEWIQPVGYGAAMNHAVAESMFNKLFIRHRSYPQYFRQAALMSPSFQLWEVKGDSPPQLLIH